MFYYGGGHYSNKLGYAASIEWKVGMSAVMAQLSAQKELGDQSCWVRKAGPAPKFISTRTWAPCPMSWLQA